MLAKNKQKRKRRIAGFAIVYFLLFLASILYAISAYKRAQFGDAQLDEIIFYLVNGSGEQTLSFIAAARDNLLLFFILFFLLLLPVIDFYRNRITIQFNLAVFGNNKTLKFNPSRVLLRFKLIYAGTMFIFSSWFLLDSFHVISYVRSLGQVSQIFEQHYVDPSTVKLEFPEKKRNLVYIYMESMENTVASSKNGGQLNPSRIPELEDLALQNTNFSNRPSGLGGALPATGTGWTVAGMAAQSSGVPLRNTLFGVGQNDQGIFKYFLPGSYSIGQVLAKEGYNQSFVMGSDAAFGGRDKLLSQHGGYKILDTSYMKKEGKLPADYKVWWGYEDKKVFEYAKEEATRLAAESKPFNLQLLTADTHFTDGYLDPTCPTPYQRQYDNVHACSSARVVEFVQWLKKQPFGANTTIVLSGDHLGMQTAYYDEITGDPSYQRTIYNAFVNSVITPQKSHGRLFTTFDMYPSTLAAMGVKIPGDHLGLGVNLFSSEKTLLETYGSINSLDDELDKKSQYYEEKIISGR